MHRIVSVAVVRERRGRPINALELRLGDCYMLGTMATRGCLLRIIGPVLG